MNRYEHTQIGYFFLIVLFILIVFAVFFMYFYEFNLLGFIIVLAVIVTIWQFTRLTITIDSEFLYVKFGPGLIRKKFRLENIISCKKVQNKWYYGWGIRLTPHGILYNVSGTKAVEIKLNNDRKYRLGTDEPDNLIQILKSYGIQNS